MEALLVLAAVLCGALIIWVLTPIIVAVVIFAFWVLLFLLVCAVFIAGFWWIAECFNGSSSEENK